MPELKLPNAEPLILLESNCLQQEVEAVLMVNSHLVFEEGIKSGALSLPLNKYADYQTSNLLKVRIKKNSPATGCTLKVNDKKNQSLRDDISLEKLTEYRVPLSIVLPVTKDPTRETIIIHSTYLRIELSDPGQEDGDIIKVTQNDKPIIDNYELKAKPKSWDIQVTPSSATTFKFISLTDGTNTAKAVIYEEGKQIETIELSSYSKEFPAQLILIHEPKD